MNTTRTAATARLVNFRIWNEDGTVDDIFGGNIPVKVGHQLARVDDELEKALDDPTHLNDALQILMTLARQWHQDEFGGAALDKAMELNV